MSRTKAIAVSLAITAVIACGMLAIGASALFNPYSVAASSAPAGAPPAAPANDMTRLQEQVLQYRQQLDQANAQLQQYQAIVSQLQRRGVIRVLSDGTIQVRGHDD